MNRAVLVKSCVAFSSRRDACKDTWVTQLRSLGYRVWFVCGNAMRQNLGAEQIDVSTGDRYEDNSIKLKYALGQILKVYTADFMLFVVDDDTFVHPARWIAHVPTAEFECRLFTPADNSNNGGNPWAHGGSGWYMSRRLCGFYTRYVTKRTSADDIQATNIARQANAEIVDAPHLYAGDKYFGLNDRVAADNQFITSHHLQPEQMRELYKETLDL